MTTQPSLLPAEAPTLLTVTGVRVTLQPDALVVAFAVEGDEVHVIKWHARDAAAVRDLARQLVTLAEGMAGAETVCLCDVHVPKCPVHQPLLGSLEARDRALLEQIEEDGP